MADPSLRNPSGKIVADYCLESFRPRSQGIDGQMEESIRINGEIQELEMAPPTMMSCQTGAIRIASDEDIDPDETQEQIENLGFNVIERHIQENVDYSPMTEHQEDTVESMMDHDIL